MIRTIPLSQVESNFDQLVSLDGVDYTLAFLWNERDAHWYMTVRDSAGDDIATGIKVVTDIPLLVHETDDRRWPGVLWAVDTTGSETDPGLRDFGTRVLLRYVDEESVA
jgi:hypothetical protein